MSLRNAESDISDYTMSPEGRNLYIYPCENLSIKSLRLKESQWKWPFTLVSTDSWLCVYILQRWMACSFNIPTRHVSTSWLLLQSCFNTDKLLLRGRRESNALSISFISVLRSTGPPDGTVRNKKVYEVVTFSPLFKCLDILWVSHLPVEAVLRTLYTLTAKLIEGTL